MRNILITGPVEATPALLDHARQAALAALPVASGGQWRIIVADGYGIEAEAAKTCITWGIPLLIAGAGVRPANDMPMRFYQRVFCTSRQRDERRGVVMAFLRGLADEVVEVRESINHERSMARLRVPEHVAWGYVTRYDRDSGMFYLSNLLHNAPHFILKK